VQDYDGKSDADDRRAEARKDLLGVSLARLASLVAKVVAESARGAQHALVTVRTLSPEAGLFTRLLAEWTRAHDSRARGVAIVSRSEHHGFEPGSGVVTDHAVLTLDTRAGRVFELCEWALHAHSLRAQ